MRFLTLLAQGFAVQAATTAAVAPVTTVESAIFPNGTGPIPPSRLAGVNFKGLAAPPEFVNLLRMPSVPLSLLSQAKPTMAQAGPPEIAAARTQVNQAFQTEIRNSGILKPIYASSSKKYDEAKLAELFAAGVMMALDPTTNGPPATRGGVVYEGGGRHLLGWWDDLWDDITGAVEDVGCGAFATGALPGYLLAYSLFHGGNSGYTKLSSQQKFFQHAGGFSTDLLNKVNIKYSAWFAPGFGDASAVTMGSEIYVRGAKTNTDTYPLYNMSLSPGFWAQTRLIMHEMGHSKQYAARGWNVASFGWDYLFQYCKAGFSYAKNSMEVDAETYRDNSDAIMKIPATAHFKKWRKDDLEWATGYAKSAAEYSNFKIGNTQVMSIDLAKTTTKIAESQRKSGTSCVRVLWGSTLNSRTQADIAGKPWDCVNVKPTSAPTRKPTARPTRQPTSPTMKPTYGIVSTVPLGLAPTRPPTFPPTWKIPA